MKNVLILSGYPEDHFIDIKENRADYTHLSFFVSHGLEDVVLPIEGARLGEKLLTNLGIKHEYHEYRSGHGIIPQNYFDMMAWIKKELDA